MFFHDEQEPTYFTLFCALVLGVVFFSVVGWIVGNIIAYICDSSYIPLFKGFLIGILIIILRVIIFAE